ncbi:phage tail tape measure protein [Stenotrophomonas maltophilia]|uniref:phage tail tape measure protein n=1 Tax=Stenotrophomonas maltophilia TaxID=40324 RepID=UPI000DAA94B3|nr:phage tail tape measure protein [Stenotrophomonas maltophilia]PZT22720.1 phage tail tape measure protein [Stenotrophomonas maltophilia]
MTDQSIGAARIDLVVDTQQFDSAITAAKRGVADMSGSAQQQYQQLSRAERSRVDTLVRQADTLGMTRSQQLAYNAALRTSGPVLDEIVQKLARAEAAAKRSGKELNAYGVSAAQQAAAMRGVPAQITDIAVSLQGGQNPLTVFLQQGGQLKDMFGGIRPAAAALASQLLSMINPLTAAAAATAALGVAWYQVGEAQRQAELALITTGNYAGTSAEQIAALARQMDNLGGVTRGKALAALTQVAASGRFTGEQFRLVSESAAQMEGATGQSIDTTIDKFKELAKDPVEGLLKLNEAEHFLTRAHLDRVTALQEEGRQQDAVTEAIRIYHASLGDVSEKARESLSGVSQWWKAVKDDTSSAFNELGRYIDLTDRLLTRATGVKRGTVAETASFFTPIAGQAKLAGGLLGAANDFAERYWGLGPKPTVTMAGIYGNGAEESIDSAGERKRLEQRKKDQQEWDRLAGQNLSKRQKQLAEEAQIVALGKKLGKDQADIDREVAASRKQFAEAEARRGGGSKTNQATLIVARIQQQVALNKEQSGSEEKLTVSQRLRVQVLEELDRLGAKIPEADRKRIRTMLEELKTTGDLVEAKDKQKKTLEALTRQQAIFDQQTESRRRGNELDLMSYGRGQDAVAQLRRQMDVQREYEDELKRLGDRKVATDQDQWDQLAANAARHRDEQLQLEKDYQARRLAAMGDWRNGTRAAFEDYAMEASNAAGQAHSALTNAFQGAEDALVQFAMTGKLSFRDLANSIIADLARIAAKQAIVGIAGMIAGAWGGAASTGASSGTLQGFGNNTSWLTANANGGVYNSPSLSAYSSGVYNSPQLFAFAKGAGVFGEAGPEAIMPLQRGPDGRLGVAAHGGGSGASQVNVNVVVNTDGSTDVSADTPVWQRFGKEIGQLIDMKINEAQIRSMKDGGAMRVMGNGR